MSTYTQTWRPKPRRRSKFLTGIDASPFLAIFLVLYIVFSVGTARPFHHRALVDLPMAIHATDQPGARREDSLQIMVTRSGDLFIAGNESFPSPHVSADEMGPRLLTMMQPSTEHRVFIRADARARYWDVEKALDAIRAAGFRDVTFIVEQGQYPQH